MNLSRTAEQHIPAMMTVYLIMAVRGSFFDNSVCADWLRPLLSYLACIGESGWHALMYYLWQVLTIASGEIVQGS